MRYLIATLLIAMAFNAYAIEIISSRYDKSIPYLRIIGTGAPEGADVEMINADTGFIFSTSRPRRGYFMFRDFGIIASNPPYQVIARVGQEESPVYTIPGVDPPPSGLVISGAEIHEADGMFTFGSTTIQVDPMSYTSADSLELGSTTMPYLPDGFVEHDTPISLTSSVDTTLTLSTTYTGAGRVFWPILLPDALDRSGAPGPWVAPQPSTSHTGGVAQLTTELEAEIEKKIGTATAAYGETSAIETVGSHSLQVSWSTLGGTLPPRAALMQNALATYLETQLDDPTCPSVPSKISLLVMPSFLMSDEPDFLARYQGGVIYLGPRGLAQNDFDLELTITHEASHALQAHLMAPWFERWLANPTVVGRLIDENVFTESYSSAAEITRYVTPFYDGWSTTYAPWPDTFKGAVYAGDRQYLYQIGLPVSYMVGKGNAPTLCEFWSDPDLPLAVLQETTRDIFLKNENVVRSWVEFVSHYNTDRELIEPGLSDLIGPASVQDLPIAPTEQNSILGNANGLLDGQTIRVPHSGFLSYSMGLEASPRCDDHDVGLHIVDQIVAKRITFTTGEYRPTGSFSWGSDDLLLTVASIQGDVHMRELVLTGWHIPNIPNDPWPAQDLNDPFEVTCP